MTRHRPRFLLTALIIVCGMCVGALLVLVPKLVSSYEPRCDGYLDLQDNCVQPEVPFTPQEIQAAKIEPVLASGPANSSSKGSAGRVVAFAQKLDVPLYRMSVVNNVINPPGFREAYMVRGYGEPNIPNSGTTLVVLHAVAGGAAPGNAFFDVQRGEVRVGTGDIIYVDGVSYKVDTVDISMKSAVSRDADLWKPQDDRLLLITCYPRPGTTGHSLENLVISAHKQM